MNSQDQQQGAIDEKPPAVREFAVGSGGIEVPGNTKAREWSSGRKKRFPKLSACALSVVVMICIVLILLVVFTNGLDYDTFCVIKYHYNGLRKPGSKDKYLIKPHNVTLPITVNIWISSLMFFAGKLLALAFVEALTVHWWVTAIKGNSLSRLHYNYEAGRSVSVILKRIRWFNWLFFCSIVYTLFGVAGPLLQKSSAVKLESGNYFRSSYEDKSYYTNPRERRYQTSLPHTFPLFEDESAGEGVVYTAWIGLTRGMPAFAYVENCPPSGGSRPLSECAGVFKTIGFDVSCGHSTVVDPSNENVTKIFDISFDHHGKYWDLDLNVQWQNSSSCGGVDSAVYRRTCTLKPSVVYRPIAFRILDYSNVEDVQDYKIYSQFDPADTVNWGFWFDFTNITTLARATYLTPDVIGNLYWQGDLNNAKTDENGLLKLSYPNLEDWLNVLKPRNISMDNDNNDLYYNDFVTDHIPPPRPEDAKKMMGALYDTFAAALSATYQIGVPPSEIPYAMFSNASINEEGGYFYPSLIGSKSGTGLQPCEMQFFENTIDILTTIRDLTFRYTIATANYLYPEKLKYPVISTVDSLGSNRSIPLKDKYRYTRNVYHSNHAALSVAMVLMFLAVACTASLFRGYSSLGRSFSLSPLEMSRALQLHVLEQQQGATGKASNATVEDLVDIYGKVQVKYGEVAPGVLGMGLKDEVVDPRRGEKYM